MIDATVAGVALVGEFTYPSALRISARSAIPQPCVQSARALTVQERVSDFRDNGLPVATIAEMARVERKTLCSWLDGTAMPRQEHEDRVAMLHDLLAGSFNGNYRVLHRVWKACGADGVSLRDLLTAGTIDIGLARQKLEEMSGAIARYARIEASKAVHSKVSRDNPVVNESLVVDVA